MIDYNDIGREVRADELGAIRIGQRPEPESGKDDDGIVPYDLMPSAPLHEAAARNDLAAIEQLIAAGWDVDEIPHGYTVTALAVAAFEGMPTTIRKLVELGADPQKKGHDGATPLRFAVQSSHAQNVRTLVELEQTSMSTIPRLERCCTWQCSKHLRMLSGCSWNSAWTRNGRTLEASRRCRLYRLSSEGCVKLSPRCEVQVCQRLRIKFATWRSLSGS